MNREGYSRTKNTVDNWETPQYFFDLLDNEFHFTLDPCASILNHKCEKFYTKEADGLTKNWMNEIVFVNPPFKNISEWCYKCYTEGLKNNTIVVMIIPSRTDTKYWHDFIMFAKEIRFCKGRVNFLKNGIKPKGGSNFPLCVVIFNGSHDYPKISSFFHK